MGKRTKDDTATANPYVRYLSWVERSEQNARIRQWAIYGSAAVALVVVASFVPFGGQWLSALIALPAALALFVICLGIAHATHLSSGRPTMREKYSPKQRRKIALVLLAVTLIFAILGSPHIPYALGGTILLVCILSIVNLARMTSQEVQYEEAGIIDPRDLPDDVVLVEDPDILDEEDLWASEYDEYEDDFADEDFTDENVESAEYDDENLDRRNA